MWTSAANDSKNGKTATITSVEFRLKTMSCAKAGETQLNTLAWNKIDGSGTATPDWNMHVNTDTFYGNYSGDATHYSDLTAFEELRIYRDNNDAVRAFFIKADASGTNQVYGETWNSDEKYWSIDLSNVEKWSGKVALKAIKASAGVSTLSVNNIVVYNAPAANAPQYILTGSGMQLSETVAALADATVTCIDATGVTGITTNSEAGRTQLTSANPNCLFLGTTGNGYLKNTQNVINGSTCANLVLTDNKPFKAPSNFTATASSYGRAFTADKITTVCLPFALTATEAATLGTFYELSSFDGATLHFSTVATPVANKPYLVKTAATSLTLSEADKSIVATPANLATAIASVDFIGTLASTTIPASDGTYSYYAYNNGALVKIVTNAATLPAFRGYFKISTGDITPARELTLSFDDDVTGISQIEATKIVNNAAVYDLQGRRIAQPAKGLYIVNGKKVIIK